MYRIVRGLLGMKINLRVLLQMDNNEASVADVKVLIEGFAFLVDGDFEYAFENELYEQAEYFRETFESSIEPFGLYEICGTAECNWEDTSSYEYPNSEFDFEITKFNGQIRKLTEKEEYLYGE